MFWINLRKTKFSLSDARHENQFKKINHTYNYITKATETVVLGLYEFGKR